MGLAKDFCKALQRLLFPFCDQVRIHVINLCQLRNGLLSLNGLHRDLRLQARRIALARLRHRRVLSFWTCRIILKNVSSFWGPLHFAVPFCWRDSSSFRFRPEDHIQLRLSSFALSRFWVLG